MPAPPPEALFLFDDEDMATTEDALLPTPTPPPVTPLLAPLLLMTLLLLLLLPVTPALTPLPAPLTTPLLLGTTTPLAFTMLPVTLLAEEECVTFELLIKAPTKVDEFILLPAPAATAEFTELETELPVTTPLLLLTTLFDTLQTMVRRKQNLVKFS